MRVLHVMHAATGGACLSTLALVETMAELGVESSAFCGAIGTAEERERVRDVFHGRAAFGTLYGWNRKIRAHPLNRPVLEIRQQLATGFALASTARVALAARRARAELIHTNTSMTPEGAFAAGVLRLPHVWHIRELIGDDQPFRYPLRGRALGAFYQRAASLLVANSEATASRLRPIVPAHLLEVVPNGLAIDALLEVQPRDPAAKPTVVSMIGSLASRVKKHDLFVDAAARVDPSFDVELRIYGDGERSGDAYVRGIRSHIARRGLDARLRLCGHADPLEIFRDTDILVHPADQESFGRVVVEAMAAGRPVIGVRGGGVGEIVVDGETGLLAPPDDAAGIAACIESLLRDPQRRTQMGAAGRVRAQERYAIGSCATRMLEAYRSAIGRH